LRFHHTGNNAVYSSPANLFFLTPNRQQPTFLPVLRINPNYIPGYSTLTYFFENNAIINLFWQMNYIFLKEPISKRSISVKLKADRKFQPQEYSGYFED
jgi:hypothetical protein